MKANRKFVEGREAVSAVIGVILMVAITVAIAAAVYMYVMGMMGGTTSTSTPSISWTVDSANRNITISKGADAKYATASNDVNATNLMFKKGSEKFYVTSTNKGYYELCNESLISNNLVTEKISAGDVIHLPGPGTYTVVWRPTNTVLGTITIP